jgi:hypothetical protein
LINTVAFGLYLRWKFKDVCFIPHQLNGVTGRRLVGSAISTQNKCCEGIIIDNEEGLDSVWDDACKDSCGEQISKMSLGLQLKITLLRSIFIDEIKNNEIVFDKIEECLDNPNVPRFVVVVFVWGGKDKIEHANALIFDKTLHTMERFEPNGLSPYELVPNEMVDDVMKVMVDVRFEEYTYVSPKELCLSKGEGKIILGPQLVQSTIDFGFANTCAFWTYWYILVRINNPHLAPDSVFKMAMNKLFKRTSKENPLALEF